MAVTEYEQEYRREVCATCDEFNGEFCQRCTGCKNSKRDHWLYLIRRGKCPIGKWDVVPLKGASNANPN